MYETENIIFGEVKFGERVVICDPIYKPAPWCSVAVPVKAGEWTAQVQIGNCGPLGKGVFSFCLNRNKEPLVSSPEEIGMVSSDSAMIGIWDSVKYDSAFADSKGKFLKNVSDLLLYKTRAGIYNGFGAIAQSISGKGQYPVFTGKNKKGEIVYLSVAFVG